MGRGLIYARPHGGGPVGKIFQYRPGMGWGGGGICPIYAPWVGGGYRWGRKSMPLSGGIINCLSGIICTHARCARARTGATRARGG